jgi:WS/DGAT/MGAT family acyltransferase
MRMLSAQDASFIYLESDLTPMHIGGVYLMDSRDVPASFNYTRFCAHIKNRLACSPIFRQRLVEVPLSLAHPYWINDPEFVLGHHLPRLQLPAPGGWQQLMQLSAQVFGQLLVRNRPLWEMSFVEGLDRVPGLARGSFALISKVHHAAVDGGSGVELMGTLLDTSARPRRIDKADDWQPEAAPATGKVVAAAYSRLGQKSIDFGKLLGEVTAGAIRARAKRRALYIEPPPRLLSAPASLLNQPVSSSRTFAAVDFEFERIRRLRGAAQTATVNDVVLAVCAGGLREYLAGRSALPERPLVAMAPISVRSAEQDGSAGNQVSAMLVNLATDSADPLERLQQICRSTQAAKIHSSAIPANRITEFIPSETLAAAARLYSLTRLGGRHKPFFNLTITNVPGPPMPLYLAGARIRQQFGMAPILDGLGLTIVVLSYAGRLSLGLTSCYSVIPDAGRLGLCLEQALQDLEAAAAGAPAKRARAAPAAVARKEPLPARGSDAVDRLREASRALQDAMDSLSRKTSK